ncbi:unnamed protein product [Calicophoron daubneyi]|uniref:EF-hand domain-containing protein n=1 Tax=Calicophoron daubneyi TaxID=300641 RepID=A0AAV2T9Q8_CALDB
MADKVSDEEIKLYKETFDEFDLNHDGQLDSKEMKKALDKMGMKNSMAEVKAMIKKVDLDHSGTLNFSEFILLVEQKKKFASSDENLLQSFKFYDKNGDGYITAEELKAVVSKTNPHVTMKEVMETINKVDKNHDGKLDFNEFIVLMRS